jgi:hypothetical protein
MPQVTVAMNERFDAGLFQSIFFTRDPFNSGRFYVSQFKAFEKVTPVRRDRSGVVFPAPVLVFNIVAIPDFLKIHMNRFPFDYSDFLIFV